MMITTFTADQVRDHDVAGHISKLMNLSHAELSGTRDSTDRYYEFKVRVPISHENLGAIDALTKIGIDAALD